MLSFLFEIGPELRTVFIASIGLLSTYFARKGYKELRSNGGNSAFDKLQARQEDTIRLLKDFQNRQSAINDTVRIQLRDLINKRKVDQ